MAHRARQQNTVVADYLIQSPRTFQFEKAVDVLLESAGCHFSQFEQAVTFRANPTLAFPPNDIDRVEPLHDGKYELVVNFMGLYGPASPLPSYFTEAILHEVRDIETDAQQALYLTSLRELNDLIARSLNMDTVLQRSTELHRQVKSGSVTSKTISSEQIQQLRHGKSIYDLISYRDAKALKANQCVLQIKLEPRSAQRDFLDLFNHRLISLFYQAKKKYHPESDPRPAAKQRQIERLFALIGAPEERQRQASPIDWQKLLAFSGLLVLQRGLPEVICKVITGYFGLAQGQVWLEQGITRRVKLSKSQLNSLGVQNTRLGSHFIAGEQVADSNGKFRLVINNLSAEQFVRFLPRYTQYENDQNAAAIAMQVSRLSDEQVEFGSLAFELQALCRWLSPAEQSFDICLKLKPDASTPFTLSCHSINRLGQSCWLSRTNPDNHWVIFEPRMSTYSPQNETATHG